MTFSMDLPMVFGKGASTIGEMALHWNDEDQHSQPYAVDVAVDVAFDLAFDLDLDLRDFRRPNAGLAEGGDGHGCPSSAEAPGWGLRRGP
ncbi:hypothetical protein, partial [Pseudomonas sp. JR33AA]|uniref:hypothetical protein n=1 Tax=Pseudomonas sp. JR33AA TaxID=2899113 RepID=UPI001F271669